MWEMVIVTLLSTLVHDCMSITVSNEKISNFINFETYKLQLNNKYDLNVKKCYLRKIIILKCYFLQNYSLDWHYKIIKNINAGNI